MVTRREREGVRGQGNSRRLRGILRRKWQPTSMLLPGDFHGQRSLEGYSPWGHKELDTTEVT